MSKDDPARLKDLLSPVSRSFGLTNAVEAGTLWRRWPEIVGSDIAHHAEPTSLRDGVLRVRTDSPVWATELGYMAADLCRRVNDAMGMDLVSEVKVWTGPGAVVNRRTDARDELVVTGPREVVKEPLEALRRARQAWSRRRSRTGREEPPNGV